MNDQLIALAIQDVPLVIARLKELFRRHHPGDPEPTSAEVIAAYQSGFVSSLAKDDAWLAAHGR